VTEWIFIQDTIIALGGMGVGVLGMFGVYRLIARWMDRRHELRLAEAGGGREELEMLHARMEAIEEATHRLQDLEERVDFAERMLAKHSDREQLPPMN
jgi:hypothetical protein